MLQNLRDTSSRRDAVKMPLLARQAANEEGDGGGQSRFPVVWLKHVCCHLVDCMLPPPRVHNSSRFFNPSPHQPPRTCNYVPATCPRIKIPQHHSASSPWWIQPRWWIQWWIQPRWRIHLSAPILCSFVWWSCCLQVYVRETSRPPRSCFSAAPATPQAFR